MFKRMATIAAIFAAAIVPCAALAQGTAETGTGTGPESTISAPYTSSVGKTKPPGAAAGAGEREDRDAMTVEKKKADDVMKGICVGCGVK